MTSDFNTESKLQGRQLTDCLTVVTVCLWLDAHKDQDDWLLLYLTASHWLTHFYWQWHTTNDYLQFDWLIHWFNEMILVSKFIFISSWHCIQGDALWLWLLLLMQDCYCQCQSVAQTDSDWSSLLSMNENYLMMTIIILHSVHSVYFAISLFDWLELMPFWIWQLTAVPKKKIGSSISGIQWHSFTGMMNQCMAGNHCRIMTHWTIREIILKWSNNNNCMYGL